MTQLPLARTNAWSRRALLGAAGLLVSGPVRAEGDPVVVGVSGPLTGQYAQYGADWRRGFDLAVGGGERLRRHRRPAARLPLRGQPVRPAPSRRDRPEIRRRPGGRRRARRLLVGRLHGGVADLSAQQAGPVRLHQLASRLHPRRRLHVEQRAQPGGRHAGAGGLRRASSACIGWRSPTSTATGGGPARTCSWPLRRAKGAVVAAAEPYLPNEQDFRSLLVRLRDAEPDGLVLISYYPDGAMLVRQARDIGLRVPVVAAGSVYSPKFLELAGDAAEGVYTNTNYLPRRPAPGSAALRRRLPRRRWRRRPASTSPAPTTP